MTSEATRAHDPLVLIEGLLSSPLAAQARGEVVSIADHLRQCAALAEAGGASASLIVAALLHDVAYLIGPELTDEATIEVEHAEIGAAWLGAWFAPAVVEPVRLHVEAKRYLTFCEGTYGASLSEESARTLELQGGVMTEDQARRFERRAHFESAVRLRRWDERAKEPFLGSPPIEHYRELIGLVLLTDSG